MVSRHGRVARTPVSPADPAVLPGKGRTAPVSTVVPGGRQAATRTELGKLAGALLEQPTDQQRWRQQRSLTRVLDWLETFPGDDWQDRWLLSDSDNTPRWGPAGLTTAQRYRLTAGLGVLIVLCVVRPSYAWLCGSRLLGVYAAFRRHNQPDVFAELERRACAPGVGEEHAAEALNLVTRIVIVTGKGLRELDLAGFHTYAEARRGSGRTVASLPFAYQTLHAAGGLQGLPPTLRQAQARRQLSVAELVDRYPITDRAVRDVLVHYLTERSAMLDYGSLVNHVQVLVDLFWVDLERHHPGISSLRLPDLVAQAWKQRIRTLPDGRPRRGVHTVLLAVRAFYFDLLQWSLEDPARWASWAAPCPIGEADVRGYVKETRRRQARMQERTRTLLPVLPRLVSTAEEHLHQSQRLLDAVRGVPAGEQFTVDGRRYRRTGRNTATGGRPLCSSLRSTTPGAGLTPNAGRTTPSGVGWPLRCYAEQGFGSRSFSS